ncbi:ATPase, AAA superfamily [Bifidobacterium hapali]|uniref:ATPase, AAA superfamily n=1 Tax=Bifidobacterium hapali TaxID=1630172 RepID=A0A261FSQ6_9BIFI|nr:DUF4143 domain-containing protein [Bifidobacterium hapali]OZG62108.1 ATPase, AAA superfamily [Bifidobacterium hapali]
MASYISRPLAQILKQTRAKVLVLEGARAVGKTMLVQRELPEFHYESLADESTYRYAKHHLRDWLSSLPSGTIIDEAQRISGLPLAIKGIVDSTTDMSTQFILTGSASITRNGLDGQDPLTRRSRRFTLSPLTRNEFYGNASVSIVDKLWSYIPNLEYRSATSLSDLKLYIEIGGFPSYIVDNAFITQSERQLKIRDDLNNVLGDTILPDEYLDRSIAQSVLQELLATPGGILNLKRTADLVHIDARTVERYVSIFANRFLIHTLPNLKTTANRQVLARSKVHPLDTSFSIATFLRSGKDLDQDHALFGQVFESYVINQIVPETQWANNQPEAFYWRESGSKPKEVDLVLLKDHELIGIEVKSNSTVDRNDFAGLAQLRAKDNRFKRGYVVYCGSNIVKFSDDMWAIPVSTLWDSDGFNVPPAINHTGNTVISTKAIAMSQNDRINIMSELDYDANIFLSYRHQDNDYLNNAIIEMAQNLVKAYEYQTGRKLHLFVDTDIHWGENWQKTLNTNISKANILLAAVTPMYLKSDACRKELLDFNARTSSNHGNKILSMIWQNLDNLPDKGQDPVRNIIRERQFISVEDLAYEPSDTPNYKKRLAEIASKLQVTIKEQNSQIDKVTSVDNSNKEVGKDYLSSLSEAEKSAANMSAYVTDFTQSLNNLLNRLKDNQVPKNPSATDLVNWSNRITTESQKDIHTLDASIEHISEIWNQYYIALKLYTDQIESMPSGALRNQQINAMKNNLDQLIQSFTIPDEIYQTISIMNMFGNLVRPLLPVTTSISNAITFFSTLRTQTLSLRDRINNLQR